MDENAITFMPPEQTTVVTDAVQLSADEVQRQADEAQLPADGFPSGLPVSVASLIKNHPQQRPVIIEGICRRGETVNVIGAPKAGKTWFLHGMCLSVAAGIDWLGREVTSGKVLLIDNELHPEELAKRLSMVSHEMGIDREVLEDRIEAWPLRGGLLQIDQISRHLDQLAGGGYSLVALDAFYRVLPPGISENDNAAMANIYNRIDAVARELDVAMVLNHHSSKGDQSGKGVTDVGSGAGSISRAADTHLIVRPHKLEDCAVLDGVARSFPPMPPMTIRWDWPLWHCSDIEPELKRPKTRGQEGQESKNKEAEDEVLELLSDGKKRAQGWLISNVSFGRDRCKNTLARLVKQERVKKRSAKARSNSRKTFVYTVNNETKPATTLVD